MANHHRGETPFTVGGREAFVVYGTREIAEIQTALGFRRPSPLEPTRYEDVEVEKTTELEPGKTITQIVTERVAVDFGERYRRVQAAFDGLWLNAFSDATVLRTFLRHGLSRWAKGACKAGTLSDEEFEAIADELGVEGMYALHVAAWMNVSPTPRPQGEAEQQEGDDPKRRSAEEASSTSSIS